MIKYSKKELFAEVLFMPYKFIKFGGFMLVAAFISSFLSPELSAVTGGILIFAGIVFVFTVKGFNFVKLCIFGAAAGAILVSANLFLSYYPAQALCGEKAAITGTVTEISAGSGRPVYTVETESIGISGAPQQVKIRITGFFETKLSPYDKIKCTVTFAESSAAEQEDFLTDRSGGIALYGYIDSSPDITGREENSLRFFVYKIRSTLAEIISQYFFGWQRAFTKQLMLGIRGGLDTEIRDAFRGAGMSHILAVSGMHLSVLIGSVSALFAVLKGDRAERPLYTVVLMALTLLYMAVAGFGMSVCRAGFMLLVKYSAKLLRTESASIDNLGAAIIAVLLIDPMACCDVGFLMSAASSGAIITLSAPLYRFFARAFSIPEGKSVFVAAAASFSVSLCAWAATLPIALCAFGEVSLAAPVSNIGAGFLAEYSLIFSALTVLLGAFLPFTFAANITAFIASAAENALCACAKFFSAVPVFRLDPGEGWVLIWAFGAALLFFIPLILKQKLKYIKYSAVMSVFLLLSGVLCQNLLCAGTVSTQIIALEEGTAVACSSGSSTVLITEGYTTKDGYKLYGKTDSPDILICLDSDGEAAELSLARKLKPKFALLSKDEAASRYYYAKRFRGGTLSFWNDAKIEIIRSGVFTLDTGDGLLLYISDEFDVMEIKPRFRRADVIIFDGVSPDSFPSLRCKYAVIRGGYARGSSKNTVTLWDGNASFRFRSGNVSKCFF